MRCPRLGHDKIKFLYIGERGNKFTKEHAFEGDPQLERRYRETDSSWCARN